MNMLSIGTSFGMLVAVFQWGWAGSLIGANRAGPIDAWMPALTLSILFGLSMDYQVFLMSRIHEEWLKDGDARRAARDGLAASGRTVTAAAAVMVFVFAAFALGDLRVRERVRGRARGRSADRRRGDPNCPRPGDHGPFQPGSLVVPVPARPAAAAPRSGTSVRPGIIRCAGPGHRGALTAAATDRLPAPVTGRSSGIGRATLWPSGTGRLPVTGPKTFAVQG